MDTPHGAVPAQAGVNQYTGYGGNQRQSLPAPHGGPPAKPSQDFVEITLAPHTRTSTQGGISEVHTARLSRPATPPQDNRKRYFQYDRRDYSEKATQDPLGLQIARAIQQAVQPAEVILYGSRAVGEHRQDSDVDILIVTQDRQEAGTATITAQNWLNTARPDADVSIRTMTLEEFDRKRRLGQSLAGQASRHGVNATGRETGVQPPRRPP